MRLGARPDTVIEWLAQLNWAPVPLADTHLSFQFARIIMATTKAGFFEAPRLSSVKRPRPITDNSFSLPCRIPGIAQRHPPYS